MRVEAIRPARLRQMCDSVGMDLDGFLSRNKSRTLDRMEPTYVYVMVCGKWVKIGMASDINRRLATLQSNCPMPITVDMQKVFPSRLYAIMAEMEAHRLLAEYRIHGEWFTAKPHLARRVVRAVYAATDALIRRHDDKTAANDNIARAIALEIATCTPSVQLCSGHG